MLREEPKELLTASFLPGRVIGAAVRTRGDPAIQNTTTQRTMGGFSSVLRQHVEQIGAWQFDPVVSPSTAADSMKNASVSVRPRARIQGWQQIFRLAAI